MSEKVKNRGIRIALDDVPFGPEGVREERKVKEDRKSVV